MRAPPLNLALGRPRVFVPISIRWPSPYGFMGGPSGYEERTVDDVGECPVVLEKKLTYVTPRGAR